MLYKRCVAQSSCEGYFPREPLINLSLTTQAPELMVILKRCGVTNNEATLKIKRQSR